MKIAQVTSLFHPATGGIENHVFCLSRELSNKDEVVVYTTRIKGTKSSERMGNVMVRRFWGIGIPIFSSVYFSPGLMIALLRSDTDVFASHGYGSLMPFFTSLAALIKRRPFVFTLHGYPKLKGAGGVFQGIYRVLIASIYLRIARNVISVSKTAAKDIEGEVEGSKIVIIPDGVDSQRFELPEQGGRTTITYVGRLDEYKGIDVLIRSFSALKKKFPEIGLRIVGKDEGIKTKLQKLADSLGVKAEFYEAGFDEMPKVYRESLAVVLPSRYEGFSITCLEALASKRAFFSTPVGAVPEIFKNSFGKDATLFLFRNEAELEERLGYFLQNGKKFEPLIEKGAEFVKIRYRWEKIADETLKVYRGAINIA